MHTRPSTWTAALTLLAALAGAAAGGHPPAGPPPRRAIGPPAQAPGGRPAAVPAREARLRPYDAVRWASADIDALPATVDPHYVRYLSSYNADPGLARRAQWRLSAFSVNSLSRRPVLKVPPLVPGTGESLIRVNLKDYGIDPKEWDRLAELGSGRAPLPEPYFQQFVVPAGGRTPAPPPRPAPPAYRLERRRDRFGRVFVARVPAPPRPGRPADDAAAPDPRRVLKPASWLTRPDGGLALGHLVAATRTDHPVLRADWFITYSLWAPRYYDLLGLQSRKLADLEKLLKVRDADDADVKLAGVVVEAQRRTRVALNNRFITFLPTTAIPEGGYYWETHDTKTSTDARAFMNVLIDLLKFEAGLAKDAGKAQKFFDATENIGLLPNGLQAYALTAGDDKLLDVADVNVAADRTSYADPQVWSARNCITCHTVGLQPIREQVRNFGRGKIHLLVVDDDKEQTNSRLVEQFFRKPLAPLIRQHNERYGSAVEAVTRGWTAAQTHGAFLTVTGGYLEDGVTLEEAAREVGWPAPSLKRALSEAIGLDPTLTGLLQEPPEDIRRDQWENNSFAQLQTYLMTYRPRLAKKPAAGNPGPTKRANR